MPERWRPFEMAAASYEAWYETPRGRRADQAERALLERLIAEFPGAETLLEVGCGTGHFSGGLGRGGLTVVGLDRSPAMLAELRRRHPRLPVVLGDAHALPFRDAAVDLALFVTTLEFLEHPATALREAVRVSAPRARPAGPESLEPRRPVPARGVRGTRRASRPGA